MVPSGLFVFFSIFCGVGLYLQLSIKAMFMCLNTQIYCLTSCNGFGITHYGWSWMVSWFCVLVLAGLLLLIKLMWSIVNVIYPFFSGGGGGGGGGWDNTLCLKLNGFLILCLGVGLSISVEIVNVMYPGFWMVPCVFLFFFQFFFGGGRWGVVFTDEYKSNVYVFENKNILSDFRKLLVVDDIYL